MFVFLIFNFIFFKKLKQIKNNFFTKFKKPKQLNNNKIKNFNKIDMGTCNICCEKLNLSTRKEILCNYCQFSFCRSCFQKYISEILEDPCCLSCKKIFNSDFINDNCTKVFINGILIKHREDVLFDREKSMLTETQIYVSVEIEKRKILRKKALIENEIEELRRQIMHKSNNITNLNSTYGRININNLTGIFNQSSSNEETVERRKFIRKCPVNDCKGFLNTRWNCGICETKICKECNEINSDSHTCLPENVATMQLLNKDTKPCPQCGSMIYRISGCFAKDTSILLWDGTVKMSQDISIGDKLIGDDGNIRNVLDITTGIDKLYRVKQTDGMDYTVNSKHILLLKPVENNVIHNTKNIFIVKWFDHNKLTYSSKKFTINKDKNETYNNALLFSESLNIPEYLAIKIEDYINLSDKIKPKLLGFKSKEINWEQITPNKDYSKTSINVEYVGEGKYYGFLLDSNHNFILEDFTVCQNCSHMFCMDCHCSWDWNTQKVLTTKNTNPHYYEFIRKNGGTLARDPNDIPCGGLPDINHFHNLFSILKKYSNTGCVQTLTYIHRIVNHITQIEITNFNDIDITTNRDLRVKYLMNELSEEDFKKSITIREKSRNKTVDFNNIYQMFVNVCSDIFMEMVNYNNKSITVIDYVTEKITVFNNLINYFNENMRKNGKKYNCVYGGIYDYGFVRNYESYLKKIENKKNETTNAI